MGNKLYVGNLSYNVRDDDLQQAFAQFGTVSSAKVMMDRDTGRSKGFGFVEMGSDPEAQAAINGMNGQALDGRAIVVNEARPREERPGGFGGGGGGGYGGGGRRRRLRRRRWPLRRWRRRRRRRWWRRLRRRRRWPLAAVAAATAAAAVAAPAVAAAAAAAATDPRSSHRGSRQRAVQRKRTAFCHVPSLRRLGWRCLRGRPASSAVEQRVRQQPQQLARRRPSARE